jgi:hypothetical protein
MPAGLARLRRGLDGNLGLKTSQIFHQEALDGVLSRMLPPSSDPLRLWPTR